MKIEDLHNKKIAILGFGLEGQSTLKFLQKQGIEDITILDKTKESVRNFGEFNSDTSLLSYESREQGELRSKRGCPGVFKCVLGPNYLNSLGEFDLIFKSPGISPFEEKLLPHREKFISGAHIFFENYNGKVIGITGTKGKSTISTLTYECLVAAGYSVKLVGNIGNPVLDEVDIVGGEEFDFVVYEMSSYMLQDFQPNLYVGFLNNIYPCHLDWHYDSMNIYKEAKLNILRNAKYKIVNSELRDDTEVLGISGEKIFFNELGKYRYEKEGFFIDDTKVYDDTHIALDGEHNRKNISGVIGILDIVIRDDKKIIKTLEEILPNFKGLPHRIEDIGIYEGIRFINDAIATTPESTMAAISTFEQDIQTLFLGGIDSGFDFTKIREKILQSSLQNIIAFPDTTEKIFPEIVLRDYEIAFEIEIEGKTLQIIKTRSMKTAVDFAYKTTFPGKVALLSCAAPSFSLWSSYREKAAEFKKEVQGY